jgi:hypothetical protein
MTPSELIVRSFVVLVNVGRGEQRETKCIA